MEAKASTAHGGFGPDPHGPNQTHEPQQSQEPPHAPQGGYRPQRPEECQRSHPYHHLRQHYSRPFFYIQPPQPYLPLQWPMPMPMSMPFNPYCGSSGMGYGMVIPPFQPRPYLEPPSFILPYCRQHLKVYRPGNPNYHQTMAYHARRVHYQNGPTREMATSEVQTDPPAASHLPDPPLPSGDGSSKGVLDNTKGGTGKAVSSSRSKYIATASTLKEDKSLAGKATGKATLATRGVPKGSFVFQTEEVRIECCSTPRGLKVLRSRQTSELTRHVSNKSLQRSSAPGRAPMPQGTGLCQEAQQERNLQTFPDDLLAGALPCGGSTGLEDCGSHTKRGLKPDSPREAADVTCGMLVPNDAVVTGSVEEQRKILRLPFEMQDLGKLRRMESSVWSVESVAPSFQEQHRILTGYPAELSRKRGVVKPQPQGHLGALGFKEGECGHRAKVDRRSLSDNECCTNRNLNKNPLVPSSSKLERFCARCLTKRRALMSVPEAPPINRREVPVSLWDEALATCRCHLKKRVAGRSNISAVRKEDQTEGESSENGSCRSKHKGLEDPARAPEPRRPLSTKKQVEKCPIGPHAKLRDKLCACRAHQHQHATWEGPRRHRRIMREDNEENQAVPPQNRCRHVDPHYLEPKWRTERTWKSGGMDTDKFKNASLSPHLYIDKKAQSQGKDSQRHKMMIYTRARSK
ncbi:uncharacterized protein LOC134034663 isoform X6 [Osmerus eperlanus]|uniref:uncharacterized protein LOC134034663 isoform X6 n=1 Tax=Osmerus eperlanus TaxID=29151 RepID=UPI002E0E70F8